MSKRKRTDNEITKEKKTKKKKINISSLEDLITINNDKELLSQYKNINKEMLSRICPYIKSLTKMVGMQSLKETIFYQIIYYLQNLHTNGNEEYLHTVIYSKPGHGKTTVAKLLGKIYQKMNILSDDGPFIMARREDFIASYVGQTTAKTKKILNSCIGGVLFIDEVYSLSSGKSDKDSFSKEAIDTITGFLSENKNNFCCIIAGYESEVQDCFFSLNQGLERRFPWVHRIDEYKHEELYDIFRKMITDIDWFDSFSKDFFVNIINENKEYFQNAGGDLENLLSKCKMFHSKRILNENSLSKYTINEEDIKESMFYIRKNANIKKDKDDKHLSMYM